MSITVTALRQWAIGLSGLVSGMAWALLIH